MSREISLGWDRYAAAVIAFSVPFLFIGISTANTSTIAELAALFSVWLICTLFLAYRWRDLRGRFNNNLPELVPAAKREPFSVVFGSWKALLGVLAAVVLAPLLCLTIGRN